jgi:hypothetical protein
MDKNATVFDATALQAALEEDWEFPEDFDAADPEMVELWLQKTREALAHIEAYMRFQDDDQKKEGLLF